MTDDELDGKPRTGSKQRLHTNVMLRRAHATRNWTYTHTSIKVKFSSATTEQSQQRVKNAGVSAVNADSPYTLRIT